MKKTTILFIITLLFAFFLCANTSALSTSAQSAVVIDGHGGSVIYEKNAHIRLGMASTTKIMTALVAIEKCPLEKQVQIADEAVGIEGSSIYLKHGETLSMEQLLYALLLQSANDAATAIAIEVAGSVDDFAVLMNEKAASLGLKDTNFTNPHGLYDDNHYTTAYELAVITKHALENETFRKIVSTFKQTIPLNNGEGTRVLVNHNKLLKIYDDAIGVKTGFTKKTGRCLVSAAEKDGTTVIAVTLNAPNDWNDHKAMLDLGFEKVKTYHLASPNGITLKIPVVGGTSDYITVTNVGGLSYTCEPLTANITSELIVDRFLFAPIKQDDVVGYVVYYNNGEEIGRVDLLAQNDVNQRKYKKSILDFFRSII